ncbi:MAG TPA: recombinase family protein, partial [Symbiobacteriaceae bacterium]|nr:recombinase family protein [Symbiobacteriaceae bacterium]
KVDRLSRNIVDAVDLVLGEWRDTCYFKSAREPIDSSTDLGRMIFSVLAMFADFERSQIRERTQSGKIRRIADGAQLHGEPAFGYRPSGVTGQWAEAPAEAALVRRIFRLAAGGLSAAAICRELNGEGARTRAGKAWSVRGVLWLLRNRTYIGEAVYGRTKSRSGGGRVRRPEPLVWAPTRAAPPLVERELFDRVQAELGRHAGVRRGHGARALGSPYLLVGLARCPCGGTLAARRETGAVRYLCHGAREGRCGLGPGYIPGPAAERLVLEQFWGRYGPGLLEPGRLEQAAAGEPGEAAGRAARAGALQQQLARLAEQERRLLLAAAAGELALADLGPVRAALGAEQAALRAELTALTQVEATEPVDLARLRELAARPEDWLFRRPAPELRSLLLAALAAPVRLFKPRGRGELTLQADWAELAPGTRDTLLDRLAALAAAAAASSQSK